MRKHFLWLPKNSSGYAGSLGTEYPANFLPSQLLLFYHSLTMANFRSLSAQRRSNRGFDQEVDEREFVGRRGVGKMFDDLLDHNGAVMSTNAHDERGYEDLPRMPEQIEYRTVRDPETEEYLGEQRVRTMPAMSTRVRDQVYNSIGSSVGTMTSKSQLDRSKGEGDYGADDGLTNRARTNYTRGRNSY